ncbi:MAG: hypothetical protein IPK79_08525 [Vampirovibrionales bacterium]|nr:hypothetical protein [Vampirovibrionales bacterium]
MTSLRTEAATIPPTARRVESAADWLFSAPQRANAFVARAASGPSAGAVDRFVRRPAVHAAGWLRKTFLAYDYQDHLTVRWNGKSMKIAQPPIGAFAVMILFFTTVPRFVKALQRAENGDRSEFWDVFRRDSLTLGTILFALDPLRLALTKWAQSKAGIRLVDTKNAIMNSPQTALAYDITSPRTLAAFLRTPGNTPQALQKALQHAVARWEHFSGNGDGLSQPLKSLSHTIEALIQAHAAGDAQRVDILSEKAFHAIRNLDNGWRQQTCEKLSGKARQAFETKAPAMRSLLSRHADLRRLPVSVGSFALVCLGIGWFPVEFNRQWNKRRFASGSHPPHAIRIAPSWEPSQSGGLRRSAFLNQAFSGS